MTHSNNIATLMRGSKSLDEAIRKFAKINGLSKARASDILARQIKEMMRKKKMERIDIELKFF